jgi:hypothetical protein
VKCSVPFKTDQHPVQSQSNDDVNITANIIFNLAHLGLSIEDAKTFDLDTYFEIVELEMNVINGKQSTKKAKQSDIDKFLL